ncbi:MAG: hypothetical protein ABL971_00880 [Vicinamibacterales bacterium]
MTTGRILGSVSAIGAAILWALLTYRNPYAGAANDSQALMGMLMIGASAVAAAAGAAGAHLAMYILFFVLFVPIGFYVMLSGGLFSLIGVCNLLYLAAAVLVHRSVALSRPGRASSR